MFVFVIIVEGHHSWCEWSDEPDRDISNILEAKWSSWFQSRGKGHACIFKIVQFVILSVNKFGTYLFISNEAYWEQAAWVHQQQWALYFQFKTKPLVSNRTHHAIIHHIIEWPWWSCYSIKLFKHHITNFSANPSNILMNLNVPKASEQTNICCLCSTKPTFWFFFGKLICWLNNEPLNQYDIIPHACGCLKDNFKTSKGKPNFSECSCMFQSTCNCTQRLEMTTSLTQWAMYGAQWTANMANVSEWSFQNKQRRTKQLIQLYAFIFWMFMYVSIKRSKHKNKPAVVSLWLISWLLYVSMKCWLMVFCRTLWCQGVPTVRFPRNRNKNSEKGRAHTKPLWEQRHSIWKKSHLDTKAIRSINNYLNKNIQTEQKLVRRAFQRTRQSTLQTSVGTMRQPCWKPKKQHRK